MENGHQNRWGMVMTDEDGDSLLWMVLDCSVNRQEVVTQSTNFGWQLVLNAFCAVDSFFLIGYALCIY